MQEGKRKEGVMLSLEQQMAVIENKKRTGQYPYIIPDSALSKNQEAHQLYDKLCKFIKKISGEATYVCWLDPCKVRGFKNGHLYIWTPCRNSNFWESYMNFNFNSILLSFCNLNKISSVKFTSYKQND